MHSGRKQGIGIERGLSIRTFKQAPRESMPKTSSSDLFEIAIRAKTSMARDTIPDFTRLGRMEHIHPTIH